MLYEVLSVQGPHYSSPDNSTIDALVTWEHMPDKPMAFTASPDDVEEHGRKLYQELNSGLYGKVKPYAS